MATTHNEKTREARLVEADPAAATAQGLALEREYMEIMADLGGDVEGRAEGDRYLAGTRALYHGAPLQWAATPKIFSDGGAEVLRHAAETMYSIMDKVTRAFHDDPAVRAAFKLPADVEDLCLIDAGYDCQVPVARVDIFLNEETGDYMFCELNTDGSAGMTYAAEVTRACQRTETYGRFVERHPNITGYDVLGACADGLIQTWDEWERPQEGVYPDHTPTIAVVDYAESISADEVDDFCELFATRGIPCHFTDIRDLSIETVGGVPRLVDAQGPIDMVWRRAVLSEMMEKPCDGADALVRAARENLACLVGSFRTWPCATKTVFAVLHSPVVKSILSDEELAFVEAHIPYTEVLDDQSDLSRFAEKDQWILKPAGGYNAMGVVAGLDASPTEWATKLEEGAATGAVIQAYAPQYATPMAPGGVLAADADPMDFTPANNMEGLYLFRGVFSGVFTRCGYLATIGEWTNRFSMGCLVVHDED